MRAASEAASASQQQQRCRRADAWKRTGAWHVPVHVTPECRCGLATGKAWEETRAAAVADKEAATGQSETHRGTR